ncbi:hypothetical protein ACFQJ7_16700 [Halovenus rubra]|uniref:Uncharacterized protein n=2 Tax=Halovenus rubra TaxID=869890 RepID=A0ACC7DW98_9EURY|nr:hypothetical protein [Halovenus rubra]
MTDDATNEGWEQLLDEMDTMAAELAAEGWETLSMPAGDAAAVEAEEGQTDRHGYAYVVPSDDADRFEELFKPDGFSETEVYRATTPSHLFLLTVFLDPESETAILLAGVLDSNSLAACRQAATETDKMYSHVCKINGTHLGSFEHDEIDPFFPEN